MLDVGVRASAVSPRSTEGTSGPRFRCAPIFTSARAVVIKRRPGRPPRARHTTPMIWIAWSVVRTGRKPLNRSVKIHRSQPACRQSPRLPLSASPLSLPILPHAAAPAPSPCRNFTESAWPKSAPSKPGIPWPPSNSPSPSTESAIRAVDPDHLVLRPRKMRSGQRFSYLALEPEETRALERRLPRAHPPQTNPISSR